MVWNDKTLLLIFIDGYSWKIIILIENPMKNVIKIKSINICNRVMDLFVQMIDFAIETAIYVRSFEMITKNNELFTMLHWSN